MHAGRLTLGAHVPPQGLWGFGNWELAQWASTQQNYYNHELGVGPHTPHGCGEDTHLITEHMALAQSDCF